MTKTIGIHMNSLKRSFYVNGMIQHAFFQAKLFHNLGYKVQMITSELDPSKKFDFVEQVEEGWLNRNLYWQKSEQLQWKELEFDLYILWEKNLSGKIIRDIRNRFECPVVAMQCGNEGIKIWNSFLNNTNDIIQSSLDIDSQKFKYDTLWTPGQYAKFKTLYDAIYKINTKIVPYVWEPFIVENNFNMKNNELLKHNFESVQLQQPIISMIEPNRDITKMNLYPILGAAKIPNATISVYGKKLEKTFSHLNIENITWEPRTIISEILKKTSIIISHQCMNELNYTHLECAWFGVPMIHNSSMLKRLGWYYPENDISRIPELWEQIKSLSFVDYLKKVQSDRHYIQTHFFTNVKSNMDFFKL